MAKNTMAFVILEWNGWDKWSQCSDPTELGNRDSFEPWQKVVQGGAGGEIARHRRTGNRTSWFHQRKDNLPLCCQIGR